MRRIHSLASAPVVHLVTGLAMSGTAMMEVLRTLEDATLGAHHGVLVYGLLIVVRSIGEIALAGEDAAIAVGYAEK